jgi:dienelactone hydrolase
MQEISYTVNNQQLVGTLLYPENVKAKNPAILLIHGWMSSQKRNVRTAQELVKLGYICMTYDLRSHGNSEGERKKLSRKDYLEDCGAAFDFLIQQDAVDAENIGIIGSSFGSYLAMLLTITKKIKWLILRVPAGYKDDGFDLPQVKIASGKSLEWRKKELKYSQNKALQAVHGFTGKILIIESEKDSLVPHQTIENYINAINDPNQLTHIVMQGADHSMTTEKTYRAYVEILLNWLQHYSSSD